MFAVVYTNKKQRDNFRGTVSSEAFEISLVGENAIIKKFKDTTIKNLVIPSEIEESNRSFTVILIDDYAFYEMNNLESVKLPNTITRIGDCAFYDCRNLKSVELSTNLVRIGKAAFGGCISLESIKLPSSLSIINESAFNSCTSLTKIIIPKNVSLIGKDAFKGCFRLTIHCNVNEKPSGWDEEWNGGCTVVWN